MDINLVKTIAMGAVEDDILHIDNILQYLVLQKVESSRADELVSTRTQLLGDLIRLQKVNNLVDVVIIQKDIDHYRNRAGLLMTEILQPFKGTEITQQ